MNKTLLSKWGLGLSSAAAFAGFIGAVNQFDQSKGAVEQPQQTAMENPIVEQTQNSFDPVKEEWEKSEQNSDVELIQYQAPWPTEYKEEGRYEHEHEEDHDYEREHDEDDEEEREYRYYFNTNDSSPSYSTSQIQPKVRSRAS